MRTKADDPNPFGITMLYGLVDSSALIEASRSKVKAKYKFFGPWTPCRITNRTNGGNVPGKVCINIRSSFGKGRQFLWVDPTHAWVFIGRGKNRTGRRLIPLVEYRPWVKIEESV